MVRKQDQPSCTFQSLLVNKINLYPCYNLRLVSKVNPPAHSNVRLVRKINPHARSNLRIVRKINPHERFKIDCILHTTCSDWNTRVHRLW